jgi:HEAT repeat protein
LVNALADAVICRQAAEALVRIGEPAVAALIKALDDPRAPTAPSPFAQQVDSTPPTAAQKPNSQ